MADTNHHRGKNVYSRKEDFGMFSFANSDQVMSMSRLRELFEPAFLSAELLNIMMISHYVMLTGLYGEPVS